MTPPLSDREKLLSHRFESVADGPSRDAWVAWKRREAAIKKSPQVFTAEEIAAHQHRKEVIWAEAAATLAWGSEPAAALIRALFDRNDRISGDEDA